jgi:poly(3-hydroxybutyrate) depolymerase
MPGRLIDKPVASSGCGHRPSVRPGMTGLVKVAVPPSAAAGARQRELWLHVPARYDSRRPVPLLLAFHGGGGTGLGMQQDTGLSGLADQQQLTWAGCLPGHRDISRGAVRVGARRGP